MQAMQRPKHFAVACPDTQRPGLADMIRSLGHDQTIGNRHAMRRDELQLAKQSSGHCSSLSSEAYLCVPNKAGALALWDLSLVHVDVLPRHCMHQASVTWAVVRYISAHFPCSLRR